MADYFPLVTAAISFALAALLARQWAQRRKPYQLVWTVSLGLLGLAALLAFLGNPDVIGWSQPLYRVYLPLTALPVGLIGLGVLQLFRNIPKAARYYGYYWIGTAILVIAVCAIAPVADVVASERLAEEGPNVGGRFLSLFGAVSWLQTLPGAIVFIGGGLYTWLKDRSRRYGLILGLGGILFSVAGFSPRLGLREYFFLITAAAAVITFIGFILSVEVRPTMVAEPAKA